VIALSRGDFILRFHPDKIPAVLSRPVSMPVIEVDGDGKPVYPKVIYCKFQRKTRLRKEVETHKLAVDFLKHRVPVSLFDSR
jgi:hypothetical protein